MTDKPFMYTDMSERELLQWLLDNTMDRVIRVHAEPRTRERPGFSR